MTARSTTRARRAPTRPIECRARSSARSRAADASALSLPLPQLTGSASPRPPPQLTGAHSSRSPRQDLRLSSRAVSSQDLALPTRRPLTSASAHGQLLVKISRLPTRRPLTSASAHGRLRNLSLFSMLLRRSSPCVQCSSSSSGNLFSLCVARPTAGRRRPPSGGVGASRSRSLGGRRPTPRASQDMDLPLSVIVHRPLERSRGGPRNLRTAKRLSPRVRGGWGYGRRARGRPP
jgi:hypothetical protein